MANRTSARPRHCMVVHAYYPLGETRVQREAERLVRAGYAVDVICLRDSDERPRESHRGVEIHRLAVRLDKRSLGRQFVSYVNFGFRARRQRSRGFSIDINTAACRCTTCPTSSCSVRSCRSCGEFPSSSICTT